MGLCIIIHKSADTEKLSNDYGPAPELEADRQGIIGLGFCGSTKKQIVRFTELRGTMHLPYSVPYEGKMCELTSGFQQFDAKRSMKEFILI